MTARRPQLPPIPRTVESAAGPIVVHRPASLAYQGDDCDGLWDPIGRIISVRKGLSRQRGWWTFFHERTHAELEDSAVRMPLATEEAVCNAMADARLADLWRQVRRGRYAP